MEQATLEFDGPPTGPREKCSNFAECGILSPPGGFEKRKDGRPNRRCPQCRKFQAIRAGRRGSEVMHDRRGPASKRVLPRDEKALRVVERYSGFRYKQWGSASAKAWEERRGYSLHQLWTYRMKVLYARTIAAYERNPDSQAAPPGEIDVRAADIPTFLDARPRRRVA